MHKELPEFEGRAVQAGVARFSGRTTQRVGAYQQDEFAIVIAKVRVNSVAHKDFTAGSGAKAARLFARVHDFTTTRAVILSEEQGARILEEAVTLADEQFGIESLFSEITEDAGGADDAGGD